MGETSLLDALLPASLHQSQRRDMVERSILWAGRRSLGASLSSANFPKDTGFVFLGHWWISSAWLLQPIIHLGMNSAFTVSNYFLCLLTCV